MPKFKKLMNYVKSSKNSEPAVYFVRHGATQLNGNKHTDRIRGWINIPLSEQGISEAEEAANKLQGKGIAKVYSSDLDRARQTAEIIASELNVPVETTDKSLRPWNLGKYEGQSSKEVLPQLNEHIDNDTVPVENGESFRSFVTRFLPEVKRIMVEVQRTGKPVAIVTHYRNTKAMEAWDKHDFVNKEKMKADGAKTGEIIKWTFNGHDWKG